jgi:hypothetical protein
MNFEQFTARRQRPHVHGGEQQAAFEAFIAQDDYLSANRGKYAERGAVFLPHGVQRRREHHAGPLRCVGGQKNTLQLRLDILNFGNLLNDNWGQGFRAVNNRQPLVARGADAQGRARCTAIANQGTCCSRRASSGRR